MTVLKEVNARLITKKNVETAADASDAGRVLTTLTSIFGKPEKITKQDVKDASYDMWQSVHWEKDNVIATLSLNTRDRTLSLGAELFFNQNDDGGIAVYVDNARTTSQFFTKLASAVKKGSAGIDGKIKRKTQELKVFLDEAKTLKVTIDKLLNAN